MEMALRVRGEKEHKGYLLRAWWKWSECAYLLIGLRGLKAEIEFPSDWHERPAAWVRLGFGLFTIAFSFPWKWVVPDEYQCSGPTYGFSFFMDGLHIHWGKCKGKRTDPFTIIQMPWGWRNGKRELLSGPETHPYRYVRRNGEVQVCAATIKAERFTSTRPWLPWKRVQDSIDINFDKGVGESVDTWKGGVYGCGYEMLPGESALMTLRRMELERKF